MAEDPTTGGKRFDPMEPWRAARDLYMDAWGKSTVEVVNSEAYAQATGAMLDSYMTVSTPFREAVEKAMLKTLEQMAMPSRADVLSLAERMTNIEMRLDDQDAKLDKILQRLTVIVDAAPVPQTDEAATTSKPDEAAPTAQAEKAPQPSSKKPTQAKQAKRGKK